MTATVPAARWAGGLSAWLGMVLLAWGQSPPAPVPPLPTPFSPRPAAALDPPSSQTSTAGASADWNAPEPLVIPAPYGVPPPPPPVPAASAAVPPDRWFLMRSLQGTWIGADLEGQRAQLFGWTQGSFTASTDRDDQLPLGFNYKANRFLLQQNWLRIDRSVVTNGTSQPSFGFRFDTILPGSDYRFTLPRGIFNGQLTANHGQPNTYGIDPIQFYGEAYFPTIGRGMDVKVGRFFCQYGVESNDAPSNALASHAYSFIYNPFTHTGILTTTKLTDSLSVQAGAVLGNDIFIEPADNATFIGSVKWVRPGQRDSVLLNVIADQGRFNQKRNFHNPEVIDLVAAHKIDPRLNYTFEGLYGFTNNVPNIGTANWMGILNYLTYDFTSRVAGTTRLEFFDDFQGQRTGFKGLYTALTAGVGFRPVKWMLLRQEVRYDYHTETGPFEGKHGLFTATSDFILRW